MGKPESLRRPAAGSAPVSPNADAPTPSESSSAGLIADLTRSPDEAALPPVLENPSIDPQHWVADIMANRE